jgi:hypothetical protein
LALGLFLGLQLAWEVFFFCLAIGLHYIVGCIRRKQLPNWSLLAILVAAPVSGLFLNAAILAAGHEWNFQRLIELYKWRAGSGEMQQHDWGEWFAVLWQHAVNNFSLPILIVAIAYLTFGQLFVFRARTAEKTAPATARRFPQFWLIMMPALFQLFLLKGCLWKHETWERPLMLPLALAAALGIMLLADVLAQLRPLFAKIAVAVLVVIIAISCARGLNHYHSISHFSPAKVQLLTMLNRRIPPDQALLSPLYPFEGLIAHQHEAKGAFYRPEVAWYLDRQIVQAGTFEEVQAKAKTGRFPYYLIPYHQQLAPFISQLRKRYKFESIPGDPGGKGKAPMMAYLIFDLRSTASNP